VVAGKPLFPEADETIGAETAGGGTRRLNELLER